MVDSIVTMAAAVKALDKKKGKNLQVLKTGELTTLADYFVLCTAGSTTQIKALCDICEEAVEQAGGELHHKEGFRDGGWVLLDYTGCTLGWAKGDGQQLKNHYPKALRRL